MNKIDNIPPFYFWHNSYLEIEPIFVPFHQKKATAAPPDESDNESNDSSILSDSELSSNDNVVQDGVSMQHQDEPLLFDDIKPGIWVTVIYEEKNCLAKVQRKSTDAPTQLINVPCLEKPLGINTFQNFKKSRFDVEKVHRTEIRPYQTQIDENGKKTRKWLRKY